MLDQLFYLEPSPPLARADPIAEHYELSILMPCLNEAETLARCIRKARAFLMRSGITGEILIADNGSTDGSQRIAETHGARVVPVPGRGYGRALLHGIQAARGRYVIMGDSDDSYDFSRLDAFVEKLRAGYHLVMGNRFLGGIAAGAMPPLHRYLGNPVLSASAAGSSRALVATSTAACAESSATPSSPSISRRRAWSSPARWW